MVGRGSPMGGGPPSTNTRSKTMDKMPRRMLDMEERELTGEQLGNVINKPNEPLAYAPSVSVSRNSRPRSPGSTNSHSSRLQTKRVDQQLQEELTLMDEDEEILTTKMKNIDIKISQLEERIRDHQECLQHLTSMINEDEERQRRIDLKETKAELLKWKEEKQIFANEMNSQLRSMAKRRQVIIQRAELEREEIAEDNEQHIGSDDDVREVGQGRMQNPFELINTRTEEWLFNDPAPSQAQIQEEERLAKERERLIKELEVKETLCLKAMDEARLQAEEDRKRQIEADRKAAVVRQELIDLKEKLLSTRRVTNRDNPIGQFQPKEESPAMGEERLVKLFAEAIGQASYSQQARSDENRMSDTSKFLARQSYAKTLPNFSGKAEEWPMFKAEFERSTRDCVFSNSEILSRLRNCLKGDAYNYVQSLLSNPESVPTIIRKLESRYGQPELIIEAMIEKAKATPSFKADQLDVFIDYGSAVQNAIATIQTLNRPEHLNNPQLLKEFENKLPPVLLMQWMNWIIADRARHQNLTFFNTWLDEQTTLACRVCPPTVKTEIKFDNDSNREKNQLHDKGNGRFNKANRSNREDFPTAAGLLVGDRPTVPDQSKCTLCEKHSETKDCSRARDMTLDEKKKIIQAKKCCNLCLKPGHWAKNCRAFVKCLLCGQKHLTVMCPQLSRPQPLAATPPPQVQSSSADGVTTSVSNLSCSSRVILKTLMVKVKHNSTVKTVRAIIDDGSQRSYILKSLADELGLTPVGKEQLSHVLFSGVQTAPQLHNKYNVSLSHANGKGLHSLLVLDQDKVCGRIAQVTRGQWLEELREKNIWVNDIGDDSPEIKILIGADAIVGLTTGREVKLKNGLMAIQTVLGWTLIGKQTEERESVGMLTHSLFVSDATIQQLWDLEAIGITDPSEHLTKENRQEEAKEHFKKTVTRSEDGRYIVSLPWISETPQITSNIGIAEKRLETVTIKINSQGKYEDYQKVFGSWQEEGIIEEVLMSELHDPCHYIPHRPIFKPESKTTPIRPVFDASCKSYRSPSLNDCLEKGPNLLELIPSILLRYREKKIGIIADIRKAFQMVEVKEEDRNWLRFLWWKDPITKVYRVYRHKRVVFGVNCSPFLLGAVLEHHLSNVNEEDKIVATKLLSSLYVDNCVSSEDTIEECVAFKDWSTNTLADAKMELREWEFGTVDESGIDSLTSSECGLDFGRSQTSLPTVKTETSVLGYKWNKVTDTLTCGLTYETLPMKITKRAVLSCIQKVFDPIGFTCPATLQPKKLLQSLWEKKIGWDTELTEPMIEFTKWHEELPFLQNIHIPRNFNCGSSNRNSWQLHTFCDASQDAYAAVVFLRTDNGKKISVQLLQAKSRVSPIKRTSIPRLELLGCTIAARLTSFVKQALKLEKIPTFYWCDALTALAWIRRNDCWGTFVGNRVKAICGLTRVEDWHHVPGKLNPADLPSRGCNPIQLLESKWWEGPEWLKRPKEEWPTEEPLAEEYEVEIEKKKSVSKVSALITLDQTETSWYCRKSSFKENVVIMGWILRYLRNLKVKVHKKGEIEPLSVTEITESEMTILRLVQKETIPKNETVVVGVRILLGTDGLYHVKTKLSYKEDLQEFKYPILLPHSHIVVKQIIREAHFSHKHAGVQFMMNHLRERFWIIQGRKAIRKVLNECVTCKRYNVKQPYVVPAPLPAARVNTGRVFEVIGVDLAGPLYTKDKNKAWIVLFTCSVYRCVHLELVDSLSTESFMDAFARFVARRGRPVVVFSDNGTNFMGANNALQELDWNAIVKKYGMQKIVWNFNPPAAPWWGGFWERLVQSVKALLRRTLGRSKINFKKLETLIVEIEAIINGRPLTVMNEDPEDLTPLSPAMFLQEVPNPVMTDLELLDASGFQKLIKVRKNVLVELKMRFRNEYLSLLVQRGKDRRVREFHVGEVVLIGSDDKKRWDWPLARIVELYPGRDGYIRVAKLKTAIGYLTRPIKWLFALEVSTPSEELPVLSSKEDKNEAIGDVTCTIPNEEEVRTRSGRIVKKPERFE